MSSIGFDDSPRRPFLPQSSAGRAFVAILCVALAGLGAHVGRQFLLWNEASVWPGAPNSRTHSRRIVERDGRRLLWARGDSETDDAEWFDVTDSTIDPEQFQYGIGKDTIASIDTPQFVDADDPRLREFGIDDQTLIIGFVYDGDARAYALKILDEHELVNDTVGGKPVTVGWWPLDRLSVVYGREIDGKEVTFGTTGYTMNNVFVLYDRASDSVWYPTSNEHLEATSGIQGGTRIRFVERPKPVPLSVWREAHPGTKVLLPP